MYEYFNMNRLCTDVLKAAAFWQNIPAELLVA